MINKFKYDDDVITLTLRFSGSCLPRCRGEEAANFILSMIKEDAKFAVKAASEIEVKGPTIGRKGGGAHSHPMNIERDIEKHNALVMLRWTVFRFTPQIITSGAGLRMVEEWIKRGTQ